MAKLLPILLVGLAAGLAITQPGSDRQNITVFQGSSRYAMALVEICLKSGNGAHAFADFNWITSSPPRVPPDEAYSAYLAGDGSKLTLEEANDRAIIKMMATHKPSAEQLDVLHWCLERPETTWIPQDIRERTQG